MKAISQRHPENDTSIGQLGIRLHSHADDTFTANCGFLEQLPSHFFPKLCIEHVAHHSFYHTRHCLLCQHLSCICFVHQCDNRGNNNGNTQFVENIVCPWMIGRSEE